MAPLEHGREHSGADAAWIVEMAQDGEPLKPAEPNYIPTSGYGMAFVGEGCIEAFLSLLGDGAAASDDERLSRLLTTSLDCLSGFVRLMDDPSRPGDAGPWGSVPVGTRTLGHHMICLNFGRQVRRTLVAAAAKSPPVSSVSASSSSSSSSASDLLPSGGEAHAAKRQRAGVSERE